VKLKEILDTILIQLKISRTSEGKIVTDFAKKALQSILEDESNHESEAIICKNCGLVSSSLLNEDGCVNCGGLDFNDQIFGKYI
jgi:hypothetical protein